MVRFRPKYPASEGTCPAAVAYRAGNPPAGPPVSIIPAGPGVRLLRLRRAVPPGCPRFPV